METLNAEEKKVVKLPPFEVRNLLDSVLKTINQNNKIPFNEIKVPDLCVVLGSGFSGKVLSKKEGDIIIPYVKLDGCPRTTVEGHTGRLVITEIQGKIVAFFDGRKHYYEGSSMEEIVRPVRAMALWGVKNFLLTNSTGGMNPYYKPGDFMFIKDHINMMGASPLYGVNNEALGVRFPDMTNAYSKELGNIAIDAAIKTNNMVMHYGIYVAVKGPQYETPAEVSCLRNSTGADSVGMSIVPEVIALNHMKCYTKPEDGSECIRDIRIAGLSFISNKAAGLSKKKLIHEDVIKEGEKNADVFEKWLSEFIKLM